VHRWSHRADAPAVVALEGRPDIVVGYAGRPGEAGRCEDAALVVDFGGGCCVLAVADGMGSGPRADDASATIIDCLAGRAASIADDESPRIQVLDAIEEASAIIRGWGIGAATTVLVAEIDDGRYRTYHVGDSEAVVTGQRGRLKWQTISHSPVGYAQASGLLPAGDALVHEERHLVDSMLGLDGMRVDLGERRSFATRDTLIAATDGVFDNLSIPEIVEAIRLGPLLLAGQSLLDHVQHRMVSGDDGGASKPDDTAFILYRPSTARPSAGSR
jgi:serine/threonine protein phosphatase PrpC